MFRRFLTCVVLAYTLLTTAFAQSVAPAYLQQAFYGVNTLQSWYVPSTGVYQTTGWWNSANALTVLANYSRLDQTT